MGGRYASGRNTDHGPGTHKAVSALSLYICSIPDDHIDPRRSAFFMAKSILRDIRSGVRTC